MIVEIPVTKNLTAALGHVKGACGKNVLDEAVLVEAVDDGVRPRLQLTTRDVHSHEVRVTLNDVSVAVPGRCLVGAFDAHTASKFNDLQQARLSLEDGQFCLHGESDTHLPTIANKFEEFAAGAELPPLVGNVHANELYTVIEQAHVLVKDDTDTITLASSGDVIEVFVHNATNTLMSRAQIEFVNPYGDLEVSYPVKVFKHLPGHWEGHVALHHSPDTDEFAFVHGDEYLRLRQPYPDPQARTIEAHLNESECPYVRLDRGTLLRAVDRAIAFDLLDNVVVSKDQEYLVINCSGTKRVDARLPLLEGEGDFAALKIVPTYLAKALTALKKQGAEVVIEVIQKQAVLDNPFLARALPDQVFNTQSTFLKIYDPDRENNLVVVIPCQSHVSSSSLA